MGWKAPLVIFNDNFCFLFLVLSLLLSPPHLASIFSSCVFLLTLLLSPLSCLLILLRSPLLLLLSVLSSSSFCFVLIFLLFPPHLHLLSPHPPFCLLLIFLLSPHIPSLSPSSFLGSGPEGANDLCFHTGEISPPSPPPPSSPSTSPPSRQDPNPSLEALILVSRPKS